MMMRPLSMSSGTGPFAWAGSAHESASTTAAIHFIASSPPNERARSYDMARGDSIALARLSVGEEGLDPGQRLGIGEPLAAREAEQRARVRAVQRAGGLGERRQVPRHGVGVAARDRPGQ